MASGAAPRGSAPREDARSTGGNTSDAETAQASCSEADSAHAPGSGAAAEVPAAEAAAADAAAPRFLCITLREACNLVPKDNESASRNPFAKITLGPHIKKSRVISRNRHPMWQQRMVFPLASMDEGEPLLVEVLDKDFTGPEFLGQVLMTVGKALQIASGDPATARAYRFKLAKKRSTDTVMGEVVLGFQVLNAAAAAQVASDIEAETDPEAIAGSLAQRVLRVQLHGLNGLRANNMQLSAAGPAPPRGARAKAGPRARALTIRFGRFCLEKPLLGGFDDADGGFEVSIGEEVVIPLAPALKMGSRRKDAMLDLKISLKGSTHTLAKTQIPISDIPFGAGIEPTPLAPISDDGEAEPSEAGAMTPRLVTAVTPRATAASTPRPTPRSSTTPRATSIPNLSAAGAWPPAAMRPPPVVASFSGPAGRSAAPSPRPAGTVPTDEEAAQAAAAAAAAIARVPIAAAVATRFGDRLGPAAAAGAAAAAAAASSAEMLAGSPRSAGPSPEPFGLGMTKKLYTVASEPVSPRGGTFRIPALHAGDIASDSEAPSGSPLPPELALAVMRSKSESAGALPAVGLAGIAREGLSGASILGARRSRGGSPSTSGGGGALEATSAPALVPSQPLPLPAPLAPLPALLRARAAAVGGVSAELSRRLRWMMVASGREVARMGLVRGVLGAIAGIVNPPPPGPLTAGAEGPAGLVSPDEQVPPAASALSGLLKNGPGGKQYVRIFESHVAPGGPPLEITLSLQLIPLPSPVVPGAEVPAVAAEGATRVLEEDEDEEDEDVSDAVPLALPPVLDIPVVDAPVAIGVNSLYSLLWGGSSDFLPKFWASEDLRDVTVTPWVPAPASSPSGGSASAAAGLRTRRVSYVKPLRIPLPLAPKQCNVWEEHRVLAKTDGGWVVECKSTNDAPKGDCFYVLVQLCGTHVGPGQSTLRISMKMVFHKPCLGSRMIQGGAEADARRGWNALLTTLQRHAATVAGAPAVAALDADGAVPSEPGAQPPSPPGVCSPGAAPKGTAPWALRSRLAALSPARGEPGSVVMLGCVVVALCVLSVAVWHAGTSVSAEIRELRLAVNEAAAAGCPLPPGLASLVGAGAAGAAAGGVDGAAGARIAAEQLAGVLGPADTGMTGGGRY